MSELTAAQTRCVSAERERIKADEETRAAEQRAKTARMQLAELEADRARMMSLLTRPHGTDPQRTGQLEAELDEARRALAVAKAERERWLTEMTEQARGGDDAPAALAQFISE